MWHWLAWKMDESHPHFVWKQLRFTCKQKFDVNFLHWNKSENHTIKLPQWQANSSHRTALFKKALHRTQTTKIVWEMASSLQETIRNADRDFWWLGWLESAAVSLVAFFASQQLTVLWPSATFVSIMALCGRICKGNWKRCFWSSAATNRSRTSGTNPTEPASYGHLWGT